jgi:hypothetical protein
MARASTGGMYKKMGPDEMFRVYIGDEDLKQQFQVFKTLADR